MENLRVLKSLVLKDKHERIVWNLVQVVTLTVALIDSRWMWAWAMSESVWLQCGDHAQQWL